MRGLNCNLLRCTALLICVMLLPTAQTQVLPDVLPSVQKAAERQAEQARERATERARERAAERAGDRAVNLQNQALERVQNQAAEQAAGQAVNQLERVQSRAVGRSQAQAERAGTQAEQVQQRTERLPPPAALRQGRAEERMQIQGQPSRPVNLLPSLPDRLEVASQSGAPAFVEINIEPGIRVLEREWVLLITSQQRIQLEAEASELLRFLVREDSLESFGRNILTFRVPPDLDADEAILDLLPESLRPLMDRNHVYQAQSDRRRLAGTKSGLPLPMSPVCEESLSIGVIDSLVDIGHPAFNQNATGPEVVQRRFMEGDVTSPLAHGTAVAGVLIGKGENLVPVLPNGRIYSAAVVYAQDDYRQAASALNIIRAVDWLLEQRVGVINISLTGPPNRLLQQSMITAREHGTVLVAAAGNNGPFAGRLYPAAYPEVLAVTAVSQEKTVYRWANQGDHIDFAALGVAMPTAGKDGDFTYESGTSLAAPVISAFMACQLNRSGGDVDAALSALNSMAEDLGEVGRDAVFGNGLLHP